MEENCRSKKKGKDVDVESRWKKTKTNQKHHNMPVKCPSLPINTINTMRNLQTANTNTASMNTHHKLDNKEREREREREKERE